MSECTEICDGLATRRKWFTADGFDELDRIAKAELDIDLHKWQREGTARILDGIDVILTIATGSGKSTLFQLYALARPEQIVLVISPLKLLQRNMVFSIDKKKNLNALAINADTISAARSSSHNIWSECANGKYQIILCAPEQLDHEKMKALLENSNAFRRRLGLVVVDEAHLIPLWGGDGSSVAFRSAFFTIGNLRSLLRSETVYLALSATLMPGKPTAACKAEAADEFLKDSDLSLLRIVVATEAFGCGIDIRDIRRVVNYGIPHNIHVLLQRFGRNARDGEEAYCYCYVNAKYWDSIAKELGLIPAAEPKTQEAGEDDAVDEEDQRKPADYCPYFKQLLETHLQEKCITRRINILYENTLDGKPAQCMRCSGCVKDQIPSARPAVKPARRRQGNNQTEGIPRLSLSGLRRAYKKDFDEVQKQILNAAHRTWASVLPSKLNQFGGVFAFLPNAKAFTLSRQILDLETVELVQRALGDNWKFWDTHGEILATRILRIRTTFITDLRTSQLQESPGDSDAESEDQDISQPAEEQATHTPILLAPRPSRLGKRKASEHDIET
ncbi:hypothetical protein FRC12_018451 [Ceratobasidium sp. 428]|nr:hypothetical protein FRC12_018451 [Ceratobasidium sp. 428]